MTMSSGWSTWFLESGHYSVINMKSKFLKCLFGFLALAVLPVALFGSASIFGTALVNVAGVADSDFAVVLVDTSGSSFNTTALATLAANADLTSSSTYSGFEVLVTTAASTFFNNDIVVGVNAATFNVVSSTVDSGDFFGILTFPGGSRTSVAATTYEIWTDATWVIPADGATNTFSNNDLAQLDNVSAGSTGTVDTAEEPTPIWEPQGWVYFSWPYAYSFTEGRWHFFDISNTQWRVNLSNSQWGTLADATGWNYYAWPYSYSSDQSTWHWYDSNTQWVVDLVSGVWAQLGESD
jgi:hypothetical protein